MILQGKIDISRTHSSLAHHFHHTHHSESRHCALRPSLEALANSYIVESEPVHTFVDMAEGGADTTADHLHHT